MMQKQKQTKSNLGENPGTLQVLGDTSRTNHHDWPSAGALTLLIIPIAKHYRLTCEFNPTIILKQD